METVRLGPLEVPRVWTGLWQLSSSAWGSAPLSQIRRAMKRYFEEGYTTFDMADHYGSSEIIFGQFRLSVSDPTRVIGATKWCVFKRMKPTREVVEAAVRERLHRMQTQSVDILQFHWQDYNDKGYLSALFELDRLRQEGLIAAIGLCNFDSRRTDEICSRLGPGAIVSNQVQFSLIDSRPLHGMSDVCARHNVRLLTYGTVCGGFLSDQWLGRPEPDAYASSLTPSQRKYLDMIVKAWGDWNLFQELLKKLRDIGDRHGGISVTNVATRWVLDHACVGAVIIGARLGLSDHADDNHKVFGWRLTVEDRATIQSILSQSNAQKMIRTIGDCGSEYR
ncbi:Aldo/keto reductase [Cylindrobasidium torrendii FP15055 ss-10]|uniref:Aldo/keto reductase n=1 Tax=Cylindrobasidium torrendii FP15055 ss-10 TaxID=1314674 RepID=A0A0D7BB86_9AGAR|nr:Aldo/keto reductase [Cylindrobasidium torrendii FP15055 ss-10]